MKKTKEKKTIVLASGGTGGHMFPTAVLANELIKKYNVVLITDDRGSKITQNFNDKVKIYVVRAKSFKKGIISKIGTFINIGFGILFAFKILLKEKPKIMVSFGGYASFPSAFGAVILRIPIILHEQNALLGKTNRFILPFAKKLAISFKDTHRISKFFKKKVIFTGAPVTKEIEKNYKKRYPNNKKLHILITGGSLGANIFGKVLPKAIKLLTLKERQQISIVQQVVEKDIEQVKTAYKSMKVEAEVSSFFNDMPERLAKANLVISRSGAMTINEIMISGKPAIMVPLPISAEDHQTLNARVLADNGAGWIMQQDMFTKEMLASRLKSILANKTLLKTAGLRSKELATLNAGKNLVELVEQEIK